MGVHLLRRLPAGKNHAAKVFGFGVLFQFLVSPSLAATPEGCINVEALAFQIATRRSVADPQETAFLESSDGRYLSAALSGNLDAVKAHLEAGGRIDARDKRRLYRDNSALDHAARTDNVDLAKLLLGRGFDVNAQSNSGRGHASLHVATGLGRARMAEFLLQNGANPNIRDANSGAPLNVAVVQARPTMARLLLKYGASTLGPDGASPLKSIQMAGGLCAGHKDVIKLLVESGSDLFARDADGLAAATAIVSRGDETAMVLAMDFPDLDWSRLVSSVWQKGEAPLLMVAKCAPNSKRTFQYLLSEHPRKDVWRASISGSWGTLLHCRGGTDANQMLAAMLPDVDAPDPTGRTALHIVNDPAVIAVLLTRGAQVNALDQAGKSPLFNAIYHAPALTALLHAGADTSIEDKVGYTVLAAAVRDNQPSAIKALLAHKVDPNSRNRDGKTALHFANHEEPVDILVAAGADVNARATNGQAPLHTAATRAAHGVSALLKNGADPMVRAVDGTIPLHHAGRHEQIAELLKQNKESVNALDLRGRTPLHYLSASSTGAGIYLLKQNGADVNAQDDDGNTPLHLTVMRENAYAINFLIKVGADPKLINKRGESAFDLAANSPKADALQKALRGETPPSR
jgi:ankyrin repeat protein